MRLAKVYQLVAFCAMTSRPLPFDPIARAAELWEDRIGPSESMAAVTSVMRVQQIIQSAVDTALRPHGLTFARYEALVLLSFSKRGSLPMRVMGERLQLHPTSVTNIVDRLEADGLVKRTPHPTDRRTTLTEITDAGRERRESATKAVTDIDFGLRGLTARQTKQLSTLLSRVRKAAGDFDEDPDDPTL
jgi:DNA-binding MarR family transcriptional regulator